MLVTPTEAPNNTTWMTPTYRRKLQVIPESKSSILATKWSEVDFFITCQALHAEPRAEPNPSTLSLCGGLSKLWSLFGSLYYNTGPNTGPSLKGTQKGTVILTIPHVIKAQAAS